MVPADRVLELLHHLVADVGTSGLVLDTDVADLSRGSWLGGHDWPLPTGFGSTGFVQRLRGWDHLVSESSTLDASDLLDIVSAVQDWVIDEGGRPWPEVLGPDGETTVLLEPAIANGSVVWRIRERDLALGSLPGVALA